jgi:hypothetical protein
MMLCLIIGEKGDTHREELSTLKGSIINRRLVLNLSKHI